MGTYITRVMNHLDRQTYRQIDRYVLLGAWASLYWVSVKQILGIRTIYKIPRTIYNLKLYQMFQNYIYVYIYNQNHM